MEQNRGNWYLLTGLILGLALGMIYTWVISPVREVDTHPNLLRDDYKDIYRSLISRAYQANNNLPRAEARLELIGDDAPALALAAQAQRFLAENGDNEMAKVLANLSAALQISSGPAATPIPPTVSAISEDETSNGSNSGSNSENDGQDSATSTREPTSEALSAPTPSPTSSPPFILQDSSPICDPTLGETLIQIIATDGSGEGVPGITLKISLGTNSSEVFYTGLKPELGLGYADYLAEPGLTYQLEVPDSGLV
ncbi:MAG: hypothetical protein DRI65_06790, partial [Chloroflexota bacterium]